MVLRRSTNSGDPLTGLLVFEIFYGFVRLQNKYVIDGDEIEGKTDDEWQQQEGETVVAIDGSA